MAFRCVAKCNWEYQLRVLLLEFNFLKTSREEETTQYFIQDLKLYLLNASLLFCKNAKRRICLSFCYADLYFNTISLKTIPKKDIEQRYLIDPEASIELISSQTAPKCSWMLRISCLIYR